jgi:hypothetical protein
MASFDLELFARMRAAPPGPARERLRTQIVKDHMGLVTMVLNGFYRAVSKAEDEDLVQAGTIGLLTAIDKYDPSRGVWSSFAARWIFHEIQREVLRLPMVHAPKYASLPLPARKFVEAERACGREPELDAVQALSTRKITQAHIDFVPPVTMSVDAGPRNKYERDGGRDREDSARRGDLNFRDHAALADVVIEAAEAMVYVDRLPLPERDAFLAYAEGAVMTEAEQRTADVALYMLRGFIDGEDDVTIAEQLELVRALLGES